MVALQATRLVFDFYKLSTSEDMVSPILQAVLLCGTAWILWKVFRGIVAKNDLDNLPGPTSPSLIYGKQAPSSTFPRKTTALTCSPSLR